MKKSFIKKVFALFTTLLLCFCNSSIQVDVTVPSGTIYHRSNVKRSNNPMESGNNNTSLNLTSIVWKTHTRGDNTYLQYFINQNYELRHQEYYYNSENWIFSFSLDSSYNLNLSITSYRGSVFNQYSIKALLIPLKDVLLPFSNSRINIDFLLSKRVSYCNFIQYDFSSDFSSNLVDNYISTYGYNAFASESPDLSFYGSANGNVPISYSEEDNVYLVIAFSELFSFSIPNFPTTTSYKLGKLHMYSLQYPFDSNYYLQSDTDKYQIGYDEGYNLGFNKGENVGQQNVILNYYGGKTYQEIYQIGYNTGWEEGNDSEGTNYVVDLFNSIINIPIETLNGLAPLTFFDLSVIRVIITILAMSVIIWLISYIMSTKG